MSDNVLITWSKIKVFMSDNFYFMQQKLDEGFWTPGLNLCSLNEACSLQGELFISFNTYHVLVIQPWNISLLAETKHIVLEKSETETV